MKIFRLTTSLFALALFTLPAFALQNTSSAGQGAAAQQVEPTQQDLQALLSDNRPAASLDTPELRKRQQMARALLTGTTLDKFTRKQVKAILVAARDELQSRRANGSLQKQGGGQTQAGSQAPADTAGQADGTDQTDATGQGQTAGGGQPAANAKTKIAAGDTAPAQTTAQAPADVMALLSDTRPASGLSDAELKLRFNSARGFLQMQNLTEAQRKALQTLAREARSEMSSRGTAKTKQTGPAAPVGQTQTTADSQPQKPLKTVMPVGSKVPDDVMAFIADDHPLTGLSLPDLKARLRKAHLLAQDTTLPDDVKKQLKQIAKAARTELMARNQATGVQPDKTTQPAGEGQQQQDAGNGGQQQVKTLDAGTGNPDAEKKAHDFLDGPDKADSLADAELRTRLGAIRDLLAANQLSRDTKLALRKRLMAERDVLRSRVGKAEAKAGDQSGGGIQGGGSGKVLDINVTVKVVLADRRPPDGLADDELRHRIDVYRDAVLDQQYAEQDRLMWRDMLDRDRQMMRQRLMERRQHRAGNLSKGGLTIELGMKFDPSRRPPPSSVFAAEINDAEIQDVLSAPPRRAIERRYSVQEVESMPELRDAIPHIEIDTIHFGFGESVVREEEVDNLDHIAAVIEKILAVHPREVFFVEGHTDAVGSDEANLRLSQQRAEAIKQALTEYYVIPGQNLIAVGYGERYLKIPTSEPEAENRRASVARATPLVGELGQ